MPAGPVLAIRRIARAASLLVRRAAAADAQEGATTDESSGKEIADAGERRQGGNECLERIKSRISASMKVETKTPERWRLLLFEIYF
jgi:hypothetical protein